MEKKEILAEITDFCDKRGYMLVTDYSGDFKYDRECIGIAYEGNLAKEVKSSFEDFCNNKDLGLDLAGAEEVKFMLGNMMIYPRVNLFDYKCIGTDDKGNCFVLDNNTNELALMTRNEAESFNERGTKIAGLAIQRADGSKTNIYMRFFNTVNDKKYKYARAFKCIVARKDCMFIDGIIYNNDKELAEQYNELKVKASKGNMSTFIDVLKRLEYVIGLHDEVWVRNGEKFELKGIVAMDQTYNKYHMIPKTLTVMQLATYLMEKAGK